MTEWLPLKRFVDPSRPITYGIVQAGADVPGGVPYIRPIDMDEHHGVRDPSELRTTSPEIAASYRRSTIRQGDLVVSIGPSFGKTMVVNDPALDGANLTQGTARVSPRHGVDARFLQWTLQSKSAVAHWGASVGGATFRALNLGPLAETPIPFVGLPAQRAMADFLDAETSRADALITSKRELVQLSYARHRAHVSHLTAAHLTASLNDGAAVWPEGWRAMRLRRCLSEIDYGIGEASSPTGAVAVLGMGNVDDHGHVESEPAGYVESVDPRLLLRTGDLLFNRTNSLVKVGKLGIVRHLPQPTTFASYLVRLRVTADVVPQYLNYMLNTDELLGLARSMALPSIGQANLNPSRYSELRIALPSIEEQRLIVTELDDERDRVEALATRLDHQVALLQERRQALITAAVTGELDLAEAG